MVYIRLHICIPGMVSTVHLLLIDCAAHADSCLSSGGSSYGSGRHSKHSVCGSTHIKVMQTPCYGCIGLALGYRVPHIRSPLIGVKHALSRSSAWAYAYLVVGIVW